MLPNTTVIAGACDTVVAAIQWLQYLTMCGLLCLEWLQHDGQRYEAEKTARLYSCLGSLRRHMRRRASNAPDNPQ